MRLQFLAQKIFHTGQTMMIDSEVLFCNRDFYVVDKGEDYMDYIAIGYDMASGEDHSAVCLLNVNGEIEVFTSKPVKFGNESCPYKPVKSIEEKKALLLSYFETVFQHNGKRYFDDVVDHMSEEAIDGELRVWNLYERVEPEKPVIPNEYKRGPSPDWTKESQLREFEKVWGLYKPNHVSYEVTVKPSLPPLPAGATRHKALPQACLTLPDAAAFMKGM